jgi:hypothetical protein
MKRPFILTFALCLASVQAALTQGRVYLVLGSDTGIWDGMDVSKYHCTYALGLFTDPVRNAARVMDPAFRSGLTDSYGTPVKLTWWMMAGNIFRHATNTNVPHPNTMTLHLMKQYQGAAVQRWGDELTLHYHTFVWTDYDADGKWYWNQAKSFAESSDDFDVTLAEMLLEEEVFPVSFRSGWHAMDNGWQRRLNTLLPYSLHNDWPAVRSEVAEPIDNVYDWSRAPSVFVPFHPSEDDYQVPGSGAGWNVRSKYMSAADSAFMNKIFLQAEEGTDQVVCLWAHLPEADFLDNVRKVDSSAHKVALLHPTVAFRYCTAVEAMQLWRRTQDTTKPVLTIEEAAATGGVVWTLRTDGPIFQPAPFVALKDRNEQYRTLACVRTGENSWQTVDPVPLSDVAKIGAAATDTAGNSSIAILRYLPDDILVDDSDPRYQESQGSWTTSSTASWGTTSRVSTLAGTDTARARWTVSLPSSRLYSVFLQVPSFANAAKLVRVRILEGEEPIDSVNFTSGLPTEGWTYLATRSFGTSSAYSVEVVATGDSVPGTVLAADVVKFSPLVRDKWLVAPESFDSGDLIAEELTLRIMEVKNLGIQPAALTSATLLGGGAAVSTPLPLTVPPMGKAGLELAFSPSQVGTLRDTLLLSTDDPSHPEIRVPLRGTVREYFAIIDDRDSLAYAETGVWNFSNAHAYGTTSRYAYPAPGVSAEYRKRLKKRGVYEVSEIVPTTVNASVRARYLLTEGGTPVDSVFVDQNSGSGAWVVLMTKALAADTDIAVTITDAMNPVVSGKVLRSDALRFQWLRDDATAVGGREGSPPAAVSLEQNYPNPFNPATTIVYALPARAMVFLTVLDILGREVRTLVAGEQGPGVFRMHFDASGLPSGVYFSRLRAGSVVLSRKMILLR